MLLACTASTRHPRLVQNRASSNASAASTASSSSSRRNGQGRACHPMVKQRFLKRPICSACWQDQTALFNKTALEEGFTALPPGTLASTTGSPACSATPPLDVSHHGSGPAPDGEDGFAQQNLRRLIERNRNVRLPHEDRAPSYALPLPARRELHAAQGLWTSLKQEMPGRKLPSTWTSSSARAFRLRRARRTRRRPRPCTVCGYPTSSGVCGVCRIREVVKEEKIEIGRKALSGEGPPLPNPPPQRLCTTRILFRFSKVRPSADRVQEYFESETESRSRMRHPAG